MTAVYYSVYHYPRKGRTEQLHTDSFEQFAARVAELAKLKERGDVRVSCQDGPKAK